MVCLCSDWLRGHWRSHGNATSFTWESKECGPDCILCSGPHMALAFGSKEPFLHELSLGLFPHPVFY